jgi:phage baseplate assembly protein gpV
LGTASPFSFLNLGTALGEMGVELDEMFWQKMCELRVAVPAVVVSFNPGPGVGGQTVVVQPAVQENILRNGAVVPTDLPQLSNVAVALPRAGGFALSFPIAPGDECLVVFTDMSYDAWWQSGGTANNQPERRRHDLTDGIAIFGIWSQPRQLVGYSADSAQLRSDDGATVIDVKSGQVSITPDGGTTEFEIVPGTVNITAATINLNGNVVISEQLTVDEAVEIIGQLTVDSTIVGHDDATISGITYTSHEHSGVTTGSGTSGPPV